MQARRKRSIEWTETGVYKELLTANLHPNRAKRLLQLNLKPRPVLIHESDIEPEATGSDSSSDEETPRVTRARRPKSALRPKGKRPGKSKKPKTYEAADVAGEEENIDSLSATPTKRKADSPAIRRSKRRASHRPSDDDGDELAGDSNDDSRDPKALPLRWKKNNQTNGDAHEATPIVPTITKEPIPSSKPIGPGDTWECGVDGCSRKVYGATRVEPQALIKEHIREHDERRAEQMTLVESEAQQVNLPVSHLIQRIREMAAQQQMSFGLPMEIDVKQGMKTFPKPLGGKY